MAVTLLLAACGQAPTGH